MWKRFKKFACRIATRIKTVAAKLVSKVKEVKDKVVSKVQLNVWKLMIGSETVMTRIRNINTYLLSLHRVAEELQLIIDLKQLLKLG